MRVLSVSGFKDWLLKQQPNIYIFSTENNSSIYGSTLKTSLHFQYVLTAAGRVCFRNNNLDFLLLEHVKEVHMYDDTESIGTVFEILCEGEEGDVSCWFLADKAM